MMTKTHTIEAILDLNPGADPAFLAEFPSEELAKYLFRLADVTPMTQPDERYDVDGGADTMARPIGDTNTGRYPARADADRTIRPNARREDRTTV